MNLLSYQDNADDAIAHADPQYHALLRSLFSELQKSCLSKRKRDAFMAQAIAKCRDFELNETDAKNSCNTFIREEKAKETILQKLILRFSDFAIILFLYTALYEVAFDHLLEPVLNKSAMEWSFSLDLSLLVNTVIVYIIAKVLMRLLIRSSSTVNLYYWGVILGCFLAFLGLTYVSRTYLSVSLITMPTLVFIIGCAALAWGSLSLFRIYNNR